MTRFLFTETMEKIQDALHTLKQPPDTVMQRRSNIPPRWSDWLLPPPSRPEPSLPALPSHNPSSYRDPSRLPRLVLSILDTVLSQDVHLSSPDPFCQDLGHTHGFARLKSPLVTAASVLGLYSTI
ncbi:hypothetical protein PROFUN_15575 [Planoprotostelium fungivorum]|uniref:Uncharacterized protein n=1 Tax=Planoprotostelium fungivorum TaxID=1890364 RepID=A0A2P6MRK3_9EUKA|nr:hypothetical protein PROFUN_15575 [Planoprotostelium fungivorum]